MIECTSLGGEEHLSQTLVEDNLRLIHDVIHTYFYGGHGLAKKHGMEYDDLVSAGHIGLMNAVNRFDPNKGNEFSTYAHSLIRGEIRRLLRDNNRAIRFSRTTKEYAYHVRHIEDLTAEKVMQTIGVNKDIATEIVDYLSFTIVTIQDYLPAMNNVEDYVIRKIELEEKLGILTERDRMITQLILDGNTQIKVSRMMNLSSSRISKILKNAVAIINNEYHVR
jgi:RNA polymerase sporulation-specific sigma factor